MLKRDITFNDLDGNKITETFYFNITKPELVEIEAEYKGGFQAMMQEIMKTDDNKALIHQFKRIILLAYGQRSDDGRRFIKSEELSRDFSYTDAYSVLFMELATQDEAAADFIKGVLPADMSDELEKAQKDVELPSGDVGDDNVA